MIHPTRRRAALLPARRGMRAAWLRRRNPDELAEAKPPEVAPAPADPGAPDTPAPPAGSAPPASPDHGPVRAAFGHPTF